MRYRVRLTNAPEEIVEATNFYPNGQGQVVFYREEPRPPFGGGLTTGDPWGDRFMRRETALFTNVKSIMMIEEEPVERSVEASIPL